MTDLRAKLRFHDFKHELVVGQVPPPVIFKLLLWIIKHLLEWKEASVLIDQLPLLHGLACQVLMQANTKDTVEQGNCPRLVLLDVLRSPLLLGLQIHLLLTLLGLLCRR